MILSNNCETVTTDLRELILADALLPTEYRVCIRVRPGFFDQVGHEIMYASSGKKHCFTKSFHRQTYQNMNRADKN